MKNKISLLFTAIIIISFTACIPTKKEVDKQNQEMKEAVTAGDSQLRSEIENLKIEIKLVEVKSQIELCKAKLTELQKPRELRTQYEEGDEINSLTDKITELENQASALEGSKTSITTTPADTTANK